VKQISIEKMRADSGTVSTRNKLVEFIYLLGRDHVSLGTIEAIMEEVTGEEILYTNGWLANYAKNVTERLLEKNNEKDN